MSAVYRNQGGYLATDCPICGQEVRADRRGDSFTFTCRGGCSDVHRALDPLVMLELEAKRRNGDSASSADRYQGRVLDVGTLLAAPDEPIGWRVDRFAADGYLTTLVGKGGDGKSFLTLALACGVARGASAAGMDCRQGQALLFDAENGAKLIGRRFKAAGVTSEMAIQPVEAGGLNVLRDLDWFRDTIVATGAEFVVFDSLRILSSGAKENDGDVMEPIITALKLLARESEASVVLVHHRGRSDESDYRGSSVILDQTDLMFRLGRVKDDPEARTRRQLTTLKNRIDEEPPARWVAIEANRQRGMVYVNEAEPFEKETEEREKPRDTHRDEVLGLVTESPKSGRAIARELGVSKTTAHRLLHDLEAEKLVELTDEGWVSHHARPPRQLIPNHRP